MIVRLSAVGDTILSLPILCALRRKYPRAKIAWVVGKGASDLLVGHEDLDELFVLSKEDIASPKAYWKFLNKIRRWRPDTVIDSQGLTKSALIARYSGAKYRVGFHRSEFDGRELSTWLNNILIKPKQEQVVLRGLELLKPLGVDQPVVEYKVPRDDAIIQRVSKQIDTLGVQKRWGIINVGAGWPSKIWPTQRYAALARHLGEHWGLPTWIAWGGNQELEIAKAVVQESGSWATVMPATTLTELAEWTRRSSLFVGSDTGPMHLAVALDVPTIALIGPMPAERVGPLGSIHATVQKVKLTEKERDHRKSDLRPMLSIQIDDVTAACDRICNQIGIPSRLAKTA